jgi:two-component sensor histidine kinase
VDEEKVSWFASSSYAEDTSAYDPLLLVGEITHRVINEYSLVISSLSLAASRSGDPRVKSTILEAVHRLRGFAHAHRALQFPVYAGPLDLGEYLRGVCSAIAKTNRDEQGVRLTLIEQPVELEAARCWRIGMVVSELIMNSVRHGIDVKNGSIVVEISVGKSHVQCRVTDNGRPSVNPRPGRGSAIVKALIRELGGNFEREFTEFGTVAYISIPRNPAIRASPPAIAGELA